MAGIDRCVACGEPVPEGRMVCPACECSEYDTEKLYETIVGQIHEMAERIEKDSKAIRRRLGLICPMKGGKQ